LTVAYDPEHLRPLLLRHCSVRAIVAERGVRR
jgi:hypothetical protein